MTLLNNTLPSNTVTIHDVEQRSPEWFALREPRVTASDAYKLLVGGFEYAKEPTKFKGNWHTRRGQTLEPEAIEIYERINGVDVLLVGFVTNSKYPKAGASPDGITDKYIEVKCFGDNKHRMIVDQDTVIRYAIEAYAQIQFGLMVTELDVAHLVLYNPDLDSFEAFKVIEIKRDERLIANFIDKLK